KTTQKQSLAPSSTACNVARRRQRMRTLRFPERPDNPFTKKYSSLVIPAAPTPRQLLINAKRPHGAGA
ncbi:hypothetical protein, partial [Litchfieldella xinjiangensis]|uniref:hypothetical protein n=1 Tax=Litchfieldella xinjiangensis TaxID=1166948 RepID=UPI001E4555CB